jgi:hypothetical protein
LVTTRLSRAKPGVGLHEAVSRAVADAAPFSLSSHCVSHRLPRRLSHCVSLARGGIQPSIPTCRPPCPCTGGGTAGRVGCTRAAARHGQARASHCAARRRLGRTPAPVPSTPTRAGRPQSSPVCNHALNTIHSCSHTNLPTIGGPESAYRLFRFPMSSGTHMRTREPRGRPSRGRVHTAPALTPSA